MEVTVLFLFISVIAVLIAGISKGGFGSGVSFICAPILAMIIEPKLALGLMLPLLMLMDLVSIKLYWKKWCILNARVLIYGSLFGIVLAILFFQVASPDLIRVIIGIISISFVLYQLVKKKVFLDKTISKFNSKLGMAMGAIAGFTSFISHAGGPPIAVFLLSQGLNKTLYQATTVICFSVINVFKIFPYAYFGFITKETLTLGLVLSPAAIIGTLIGAYAHKVFSEKWFLYITYFLLVIAGTKLIIDGLT
tara:strand:- start:1889 stop:2641 length:753 start_codon:yes stop_codon:yes gene_type:complete